MLPLTDLPEGWEVSKSGDKHIETFNADNLFEKIDGRAESFVQYDVKGMAYASFHPTGDDSADVQVYIFEMGGTLKALGKYGSEKPDGSKRMPIGSEGYSSAGSTLFYAGPYYTQIVSTGTTRSSPPSRGPCEADRRQAGPEARKRPRRRPLARRADAGAGGRAGGDLRPAPGRAEKGGAEVRAAGRLRLQLPVGRLHGRL